MSDQTTDTAVFGCVGCSTSGGRYSCPVHSPYANQADRTCGSLRRTFALDSDDSELQAIEIGMKVLGPLTPEQRSRVLTYLADRAGGGGGRK